MKFGIIKERKSPPDKRVVFTPEALLQLREEYPNLEIKVECSDIRTYADKEYADLGFEVSEDMTDCDVLFGVKEIPAEFLIPNKKYFFFSHTVKKQPRNQKMFQAILAKNIELYDHETIVDKDNNRLIGFGYYAGLVGAYNAFRAFGVKYELFTLPKAEVLETKENLIIRLKRQFLPPIKIVVTGHGRVGTGITEILDSMKIKKVSVNDFISKTYTQPVYVQLEALDYYKRLDGKPAKDKLELYNRSEEFVSDFEKFSKVADMFITGHFHATEAPPILTRDMLRAADCKLKIVSDVTCDADGSVACTLRPSTIAEPFYGYLPFENKEVHYNHPGSIMVMAIDNLPCELPKESSKGFGEMFMQYVIPAFFNGDKDGILERAKITENGKLTPRFSYLKDYALGIRN